MAATAPTSTRCVPWLLFKSVLVSPGFAELTLMFVPRNSLLLSANLHFNNVVG